MHQEIFKIVCCKQCILKTCINYVLFLFSLRKPKKLPNKIRKDIPVPSTSKSVDVRLFKNEVTIQIDEPINDKSLSEVIQPEVPTNSSIVKDSVVVEKMDTSVVQQPQIVLKEVEDSSQSDKIVQNINDVMMEVTESVELKINEEIIVPVEKSSIDSKPVTENSSNLLDSPRTNENTGIELILLEDISKNSIEDLFNRFIVENQEQQSVEIRCEELSYCLQQNKIDIHKAQQLWNEKVHIKYKIRELMERLRRHRAVMEIEHFGIKPAVASDTAATNNPLISSKSSTTKSSKSTISETENFEKQLQTDSVKRLIEDVKASMLKRDSKMRMEMESDYSGICPNNSGKA